MKPYILRLIFITLSLLLIISILYFMFSGKYDNWFYVKTKIWYSAVIILILFPISVSFFIKFLFNSNNGSIGLGALSLLILGPYFGYYLDKKWTSEFIKFGISTKGIVTKIFYSKGERMYYMFKTNGKTYTSFNEMNLGVFNIGDTIEILYDPNDPNNNIPKINLDNKK